MTASIPVWTANRGTMMMIKVALGQASRTPLFVQSAAELERAVADSGTRCIIAGLSEIQSSGLNVASLATRFRQDILWVILVIGQTRVEADGLRVRTLRVPFSATELRQAIESDVSAATTTQAAVKGSDLTAIVQAEIERIVREKADAMVAEAVMKMVPELAETMIKAELDRLLSETGEKVISTDPVSDDET